MSRNTSNRNEEKKAFDAMYVNLFLKVAQCYSFKMV